jgi:hypothetical protein
LGAIHRWTGAVKNPKTMRSRTPKMTTLKCGNSQPVPPWARATKSNEIVTQEKYPQENFSPSMPSNLLPKSKFTISSPPQK